MLVDKNTQLKRILICKACPNYRKRFQLFWGAITFGKPQCGKCKCLINSKTLFEASECPEKKW